MLHWIMPSSPDSLGTADGGTYPWDFRGILCSSSCDSFQQFKVSVRRPVVNAGHLSVQTLIPAHIVTLQRLLFEHKHRSFTDDEPAVAALIFIAAIHLSGNGSPMDVLRWVVFLAVRYVLVVVVLHHKFDQFVILFGGPFTCNAQQRDTRLFCGLR